MPKEPSDVRTGSPGAAIVAALFAIATAAAGFAVWFQWNQTRRCLAFYGPEVAECIRLAPRVELWTLRAPGDGRGIEATLRQDLSQARGLVHLRHGLVEDANFGWAMRSWGKRPATARWDLAIAFFDHEEDQPAAVLAFDMDEPEPAVTVVGRPGRVPLGRIANGLRTWLEAVAPGAVDATNHR